MSAPDDLRLWTHVRRSVTPLGQPCPGPVRRPVHGPRHAAMDLHGDTVEAAYGRVRGGIAAARTVGRREIVVVTGRSGAIRAEFPTWAALNPDIRAIEGLPGGGAYRIHLRRSSPAPGR